LNRIIDRLRGVRIKSGAAAQLLSSEWLALRA